jgi:hypothetical protein
MKALKLAVCKLLIVMDGEDHVHSLLLRLR